LRLPIANDFASGCPLSSSGPVEFDEQAPPKQLLEKE